jgi:hypothetical protein
MIKLYKSVNLADSVFEVYKIGNKLEMWNLDAKDDYNET